MLHRITITSFSIITHEQTDFQMLLIFLIFLIYILEIISDRMPCLLALPHERIDICKYRIVIFLFIVRNIVNESLHLRDILLHQTQIFRLVDSKRGKRSQEHRIHSRF